MKQCAICSLSIEKIEEPAILFIGRLGHPYEICPECEAAVERFITPKSDEDRRQAADIVYDRYFRINTGYKGSEMLQYMKSLFDENGETLAEAQEALRQYHEETSESENAAPVEDIPTVPIIDEEDEMSEEEYLADTAKKTSWAVKIIFLLLFLAIGGGAIVYGILRSSTFAIVSGALIALLGLASIVTKD